MAFSVETGADEGTRGNIDPKTGLVIKKGDENNGTIPQE